MVFRRDSKVDAFQRQINALRHQLGAEPQDLSWSGAEPAGSPRSDNTYLVDLPDLDAIASGTKLQAREHNSADSTFLGTVETAIPAADLQTSVIAHTTAWNGTFESSGSLHIHGRVDGSLTAREDVFVAEEGEVDASINAANVTVAGNVRGSIHCANRFEILPRGRVAGDVQAPVIVIHEGALISGEVAMTQTNQDHASAAAVRAARSRA